MPPEPGNIIALDFETAYASDYTLKSLSTSEYIRDERFKALMIGIRDGAEPAIWYPHAEIPRVLKRYDWKNKYVLAHNTAFDGFILSHHYGVRPKGYLDTLSMSRALFGHAVPHGLNDVAERLGVGNKLQGVLSKARGLWELPTELEEEMGEYCCVDVDLCYDVYMRMAPHLPAEELEVINITLAMFCDPVLRLDHGMIERAISDERGKKAIAVLAAKANKEWLTSNDKFAELLRRHGVSPPLKISKTTGKPTYAFAKTDAGMRQLRNHPIEDVRELVEARLTVKSTINESRAERLRLAGAGNLPIPVLLNYCGAHTTRWSGGNKMNMQNLPRPEYDDQGVMLEDSGLLRRSLLAPDGHVLVVADASQIEARITAWLCGQWDLVKAFADADAGLATDVYRLMAAKLYNKHPKDVTKDERFIGKMCVLGLGYGMGAVRFQESLEQGAMGPPVFLPIETCYQIVDFYRRTNFKICDAWTDMSKLLAHMARAPGPDDEVRELQYGPIEVGYGYVRLPNGLFLHYPQLEYEPGSNRYTYRARGGRTSIYGAKFLENIVQALSRTMIAGNMVTLHREGHRIVTTTHDELVALAKTADAEMVLARMIEVMRTPPAWAAGLPLNAEGGFARNYSK